MNFTRLKLYHYAATRSTRVKWLLHELLDDDFDVEVVPVYECAQYSPEYLEKNPNHNVPSLEITLENGERRIMLESGAMVELLADVFPEKGLAPAPNVFSMERADYLQMLHFGATSMDMMLWQIRIHTHLLDSEADEKTIVRYRNKFTQEVEPQLKARLGEHPYTCGTRFSAVDCVMDLTSTGPWPTACVRMPCSPSTSAGCPNGRRTSKPIRTLLVSRWQFPRTSALGGKQGSTVSGEFIDIHGSKGEAQGRRWSHRTPGESLAMGMESVIRIIERLRTNRE